MIRKPVAILLAAMLTLACGMAAAPAKNQGRLAVVVTVPALAHLVKMVRPDADITVLIGQHEDAHHASLTPYERFTLSKADWIVSTGVLEGGMADSLSGQDLDQKHIRLLGRPKSPATQETHASQISQDAQHFWFDLDRVSQAVRVLAHRMNGDRKKAFDTSLMIDAALRDRLSPVRGKPVVTLHGGLRSFLERYELTALYAVQADHEAGLGANDLAAIIAVLSAASRPCLIADRHTPESLLTTIKREAGPHVGIMRLDFAGGGHTTYQEMMMSLGDKLYACLSG